MLPSARVKTVILAGGLGTRLSEETGLRPKPMVEIGNQPILWHLMNVYAHHGFTEFVVALGYKQEIIKQYFLNFDALGADLSLDLGSGKTTIHETQRLQWKVHLVDTGPDSQTGGRLKRLKKWLVDDETFMMTYGDGLSNIDIRALVAFHKSHGKLATITAVPPPARFGVLELDGNRVTKFSEKPQLSEGRINAGFFVLNRKVIDYIEGDDMPWEQAPLRRLADEGQLHAFMHDGFWQPMDTIRDKKLLEHHWESGKAPWRVWK